MQLERLVILQDPGIVQLPGGGGEGQDDWPRRGRPLFQQGSGSDHPQNSCCSWSQKGMMDVGSM